jgi:hypothetical protein
VVIPDVHVLYNLDKSDCKEDTYGLATISKASNTPMISKVTNSISITDNTGPIPFGLYSFELDLRTKSAKVVTQKVEVTVCGLETPVILIQPADQYNMSIGETLKLKIEEKIVKSSNTSCPFTNYKLFNASSGQEVSQDLHEIKLESGVSYLEIKGVLMGASNFVIGFDHKNGTSMKLTDTPIKVLMCGGEKIIAKQQQPIVSVQNTGDSNQILKVLTVSELFTSSVPSCGITEYSLVKKDGGSFTSYTSPLIALKGADLEISTQTVFTESVLVQAKTQGLVSERANISLQVVCGEVTNIESTKSSKVLEIENGSPKDEIIFVSSTSDVLLCPVTSQSLVVEDTQGKIIADWSKLFSFES